MKMEQSMSRADTRSCGICIRGVLPLKGNCWDNAPTERFFRSLKHEQLTPKDSGLKRQPCWVLLITWLFTTGNGHTRL
jgi:transposase InsO family protein